MIAEIIKTFKTETAHIVREAVSERCKFNVHGHSYVWEVGIKGPVKPNGMVLDFKELQPIKDLIDKFDHAMVLWADDDSNFIKFFLDNCKRVLIMKKNTTAENMASLVYNFVTEWLEVYHPDCSCVAVKVHETVTGCAKASSSDGDDVFTYFHNDKT